MLDVLFKMLNTENKMTALAYQVLYVLCIRRNGLRDSRASAKMSALGCLSNTSTDLQKGNRLMTFAFARTLATRFWNDQHGFIVSAELVLVGTIAVLSMVVGLSEVAININNELEDVGSAFGSLSQGYCVQGASGCRANINGSCFWDTSDFCDCPNDIQGSNSHGEY